MLNIFSKILMILFLAATPFLFVGFGKQIIRIASDFSLADERWFAFLLGALVFVPVHFIAKRLFYSAWCWLETFEHEITHLVVGLIFLKIPVGFRVSAHEGGEVRQIGRGNFGNTWVTLAPYFLPTVSLVVLLVAYLINLDTLILLGILGFTTVFHLVSNWTETSFRQPDLQKAGIVKTVLILPVMNVVCYGAVLSFVAGSGAGFLNFWYKGIAESYNTLVKLF